MCNCLIRFRGMEGRMQLLKMEEVDCEYASVMDNAIEPLSGKPFFHVFIQKSHIIGALGLPVKITRELPRATIPTVLICGSRKWEIIYLGSYPTHKRFDVKWKKFVVDNRLKIGDACVFELMESERTMIKFKVQILRGDFPSELLARTAGSSDKPIVID